MTVKLVKVEGEPTIIDHRAELIEAAKMGIREYLRSTRGAHHFGARADIQGDPLDGRFFVKFGDDDRIYFDVFESYTVKA